MSLIALTEQLRAGRSMARTLLLLIALTGAVIVGLLAMHSLNTHTAAETGHHATMAADPADMSTDSHAAATTAVDDGCADCGSDHSSMFAMACVLALLATVLLLARPAAVRQWLALLPRPGPPVVSPPGIPGLRPPSLTALCISRT
ncbi:DUF6153 family protein [Microbacterium pygmaeum]|uniref:Uncharacterized protein n=1 Tax=Microbacterium pygmaeum TaxID=370764 RepID=A0A1G8ANN6_9MICO|nr:DUF6153 family protein [Microbacterium pygmaeum]SDH21900.1 hypothetical protein SAMN04489810_2417 [Microbacterium pygmaeum]